MFSLGAEGEELALLVVPEEAQTGEQLILEATPEVEERRLLADLHPAVPS
jgi:hypothetical protein